MEEILSDTSNELGVWPRYEILFVRKVQASTTVVRLRQKGFGQIYLDCLATLDGHSEVVFEHIVSVLGSPYFIYPVLSTFWDGVHLRLAFQNGVLWTWNWCTGCEVVGRAELTGLLSNGAWSQNGQHFVGLSEIRKILLLAESGQCVASFKISSAALSEESSISGILP